MASTTYEGYIKDVHGNHCVLEMMTLGMALPLKLLVLQHKLLVLVMVWLPLVSNFGTLTFAQVAGAGYLDPVTRATLEGGLLQFGFTQAEIDEMSMAVAQASYYGTATALTAQATQLSGTAILMADQEADVKQTGSGVTPILGANISLLDEDLNIGIKYEFQTEIELENETAPNKGFAIGLNPNTGAKIEMFPNGAKTDADMPALLSVGFEYKFTESLMFSAGYHTYFDGKTGWAGTGNSSKIDKNSIEFAAGLEYKISEKLLISGGYLRTATGANSLYMSDITHALNSNSGSIGGAYNISDNFRINFGVAYTKYETTTFKKTHELTPNGYKESYGRDNFTVAVGVDFSIFK